MKREIFAKVIKKAKEACRNSGADVEDHFPDFGKVIYPKNAKNKSEDESKA